MLSLQIYLGLQKMSSLILLQNVVGLKLPNLNYPKNSCDLDWRRTWLRQVPFQRISSHSSPTDMVPLSFHEAGNQLLLVNLLTNCDEINFLSFSVHLFLFVI